MQTVEQGLPSTSLKRILRVLRPSVRVLFLLLPALACSAPADAQGVDCTQLQSQLAAGSQGDPQAAARYSAALRSQQSELDRTAAYAQQLGCNNRQFLFFGSPPPPQCGGIEQQMQRMRGNLAQLQAQLRSASGESQRQALLARYDAYCRQRRSGNIIESLFGGPTAPMEQQSLDDPNLAPPPEDTSPHGGAKAVCVRSCDGGFFPVSYSARRGNNDDLEELCHALCPNAETQLFTYSLSGDIDQAVSNDGTPYKSMPNAFRYRTKFDPTCTCKPPNMSWVQALANAESLLGRSSKSDIMVTEQKSAELSRPVQARVTTPARGKGTVPAKSDDDPTLAAEAAANANSPTAGNSSAGIAAGTAAGAKTYGLTDGQSRVDVDANGVKRRVRVVGPTL